MVSNSESDITDSEIDEYKEKPYSLLKDGILKVKRSDGSLKCPFCPGKKKQVYGRKDLLQHAQGIGSSSSYKRTAKAKAKHLALAAYLQQEQQVRRSSRCRSDGECRKLVRGGWIVEFILVFFLWFNVLHGTWRYQFKLWVSLFSLFFFCQEKDNLLIT